VLAAASGAAAPELIGADHDIDILFTVIVMPGGMNGRQVADEAVHQRPALKVLFTAGYAANAIVHHGQLDSDIELISKPLMYETLGRKIGHSSIQSERRTMNVRSRPNAIKPRYAAPRHAFETFARAPRGPTILTRSCVFSSPHAGPRLSCSLDWSLACWQQRL
jgi:DNA-binding LytR/AlgR family response regulator